MDLAYIEK
ncbi:Protein of unknown function [Bacillus wiedmannii]|nr:Protein of unknown function [Bacillus wiedmannii]